MNPLLSDAWSGWASTLLGGFLGACTVVVGVWLAYWLSEKSRQEHLHQSDLRKAEDERRAAAAQLMLELSNLRDAVCGRRQGLTGTANLWKMRNALFTTHVSLRRYPSYEVVREFYETAYAWRDWVRDAHAAAGRQIQLQEEYPVVDDYREVLRRYGDDVIKVLQDHLEDRQLTYEPPTLPPLPDPQRPSPRSAT